MEMTKTEREVMMYGMTEKEVREEPLFTPDDNLDKLMYAMSILSDTQDNTLFGGSEETTRKLINKAKFWISEVMTDLRKKGV